MQRDIESLITQYVNRYNSGENVDRTYRNSLQAAGNLNLQDVSREDMEQVMRPFLYSWGRMGRILGQSKFADWRENLAQAARRNASLLERYSATDLADAKLNTERPLIEHLYDSFRNAVGQVAATKSLHLLSPGFFPMWDTAIALSARKERGGGSVTVVAAQEFSKEDYYQFVGQVRSFIAANSLVISLMAERYGKTKVKIVDEVLWWATQRPLCLIL